MTALAQRLLRLARPVLALVGCAAASAAGAQVTGITGITGGGQPFSNLQPSLAVTQVILRSGIYPSPGFGTASGGTLGFVYSTAGTFAPGGSALADGRLLPINVNTALYSLVGNNYGGNVVFNFALPDLRGRAVVGDGNGPGLRPWVLGQAVGSALETLSPLQMPAHQHAAPGGALTDPAGGASAFRNIQPSLAMKRLIAVTGAYPTRESGVPPAFLGQVATFSGNFVPGGWAEAAGQLLPINQNAALFSLLGTTYGGDGISTFALPDLRGRVSVGASDTLPLGSRVGAEFTTLTEGQLPAHVHGLPGGGATGEAGAGLPVDNLQPSLALTPLIALDGLFPSPTGNGGVDPEFVQIGQIVEFAGDFAPLGWAIADGRLLSIAEYESLYQLFGTTYGGDGFNTFALPDLRGRTMVGTGAAPLLGQTLLVGDDIGAPTVTLGLAQLPPHDHVLAVPEPGAAALLLAGLAGLGLKLRRRRG